MSPVKSVWVLCGCITDDGEDNVTSDGPRLMHAVGAWQIQHDDADDNDITCFSMLLSSKRFFFESGGVVKFSLDKSPFEIWVSMFFTFRLPDI